MKKKRSEFKLVVHMPEGKYFSALAWKIRKVIEEEIHHTEVSIQEIK